MKAYRARKKPRLTLAHSQKRLEFAREHCDWSASDRSRVVFSDESRFFLYRNDGRPYFRHRPGEAYRDDCVQPTLKHGGGGLMVWGCMGESGVVSWFWSKVAFVLPTIIISLFNVHLSNKYTHSTCIYFGKSETVLALAGIKGG